MTMTRKEAKTITLENDMTSKLEKYLLIKNQLTILKAEQSELEAILVDELGSMPEIELNQYYKHDNLFIGLEQKKAPKTLDKIKVEELCKKHGEDMEQLYKIGNLPKATLKVDIQ